MSVMMLDTKVYELVLAKLYDYTTKPDSIGADRNEQVKKLTRTMIEDEIKAYLLSLVQDWCILNELTFTKKYLESEFISEHRFIKLKGFSDITRIDTMQFLKYLECIEYQIEWKKLIEHYGPRYKDSYETLLLITNNAKDHLLHSMKEWKDAKWSDAL